MEPEGWTALYSLHIYWSNLVLLLDSYVTALFQERIKHSGNENSKVCKCHWFTSEVFTVCSRLWSSIWSLNFPGQGFCSCSVLLQYPGVWEPGSCLYLLCISTMRVYLRVAVIIGRIGSQRVGSQRMNRKTQPFSKALCCMWMNSLVQVQVFLLGSEST